MSVAQLKTDIANNKYTVGGVEVSSELLDELVAQREVERAAFHPLGVPTATVTLPVVKGTHIVIFPEVKLTGLNYNLTARP